MKTYDMRSVRNKDTAIINRTSSNVKNGIFSRRGEDVLVDARDSGSFAPKRFEMPSGSYNEGAVGHPNNSMPIIDDSIFRIEVSNIIFYAVVLVPGMLSRQQSPEMISPILENCR